MEVEPWQLIVLLGAFAAVAAFAAPRRKAGTGPSGAGTDRMQAALEQFMENMEADNREIVESIARLQHQQREDNAVRDERIAVLERRCAELADKLSRAEMRLEERVNGLSRSLAEAAKFASAAAAPAAVAADAERAAEKPPASSADGETPIRERYAELFDLHAQGKSTDAIAKKVGMHKGEVMLILQLAKQEEERRV